MDQFKGTFVVEETGIVVTVKGNMVNLLDCKWITT